MTIVQAMKVRKRLVSQLQRARTDIREWNRTIIGNPKGVDVELVKVRELKIFDLLTNLRTAIAVANGPIWEKLMRMTEIKERIGFLRSVPTLAGIQPSRRTFGVEDAKDVEWEVAMTKADVDAEVSSLEKWLSSLQDQVDAFNATTEIDITIPEEFMF